MLPEDEFEGVTEGFAVSVPVEVFNRGRRPFAVLSIEATGLAHGSRRLFVPAGDHLRAFGFVPPGTSGRFRLGIHFPRPGTGSVCLRVHLRPLPEETSGRPMEEIVLPPEGEEVEALRCLPAAIAPRRFDRPAALARVGGKADEAFYSAFLEAWVVRRGNAVYLVRVSETVEADGLDLEAAAVLDDFGPVVPLKVEGGRIEGVPGRAARRIIERALRLGQRVDLVTYSRGRRVIRVGR